MKKKTYFQHFQLKNTIWLNISKNCHEKR